MRFVGNLVDFAGDALEEGIDLLLRHELFVAHCCSLSCSFCCALRRSFA
jgi:hypothetical protein